LIAQWLERRKRKRDKEAFQNGYDYAAGKLLRMETTPEELEMFLSDVMGKFEYGTLQAACDFHNLIHKETR